MKAKIAVLFLVGLLCLTTGCSNTSPITKEPAPVSSSESKETSDQAKPAQAEQKTEVENPQSTAQKGPDSIAEATASVSEWDTQTETVPTERESSTTPPTQPSEPPTQEPTEHAFDIGHWISFAKSYAESVGLTLNSGAVYCWDNPIDADSGCIYLERDIQSRFNRYAADGDITDVWIWYEFVSANSYRIYIGYA